MKLAYYNEIDPYAAEWLRRLILFGLIAPGDVDERDIKDVHPDDLRGYRQCHFFAGIGAWSYALRLAGWDDWQPVWTGSCPCQPFSAAGRGLGVADERHLWPHWHHLIRECRPPVVFGEQVASKDGLGWFDLVRSDLEGEGYAVGAADLCAAGVGAPHIRQRLWFVADAGCFERERRENARRPGGESQTVGGGGGQEKFYDQQRSRVDGLADADGTRPQGRRIGWDGSDERAIGAGGVAGFWSNPEWLPCRDGKTRPTQPGLFPLAHGATARVGRLRAYGNAIVPQVAATFIAAAMEARP